LKGTGLLEVVILYIRVDLLKELLVILLYRPERVQPVEQVRVLMVNTQHPLALFINFGNERALGLFFLQDLDVLHTHTLLEVASLFVQLQTPI
jgi:hypothetical protein